MSTRDFIGPSGGRLARAKLETSLSAAIHASARRRRRRDARAKFPVSPARFDVEPQGFASSDAVVAPRFISDAGGGEARRRTRTRKNVRRSRPPRLSVKRAFSAEKRRFGSKLRKRRAALTSRGRNAFIDGDPGGSGGRRYSRRRATGRMFAAPRLRDVLDVGFAVATPRNERGFYGVAIPSGFAPKRAATTRRFDADSTPRRTRVDFPTIARGAFADSKCERTRRAPDFYARSRSSLPRFAGNGVWRRERADASPSRSARRRFSAAFIERPASQFGRVGTAAFPSSRGAREGEGRRRGSSPVFYSEPAAAFISSPRDGSERFSPAPRGSAPTPSEADFAADFGAFDAVASDRVEAPSRLGTPRQAARRSESAADWRLPFPRIDGVAERATSLRVHRARTDERRSLAARDAVEFSSDSAAGRASWRVADEGGGRDGDARTLATIERLLKESRDALVALVRDGTGDLTLTTE